MKKNDAKKLPELEEIEKAAGQIKQTDFWLCVQFADVLIRYIETTMKEDMVVSRLQGSVMYFLVLNGGKSTPTRLAQAMFRSKHSITKIIDSLEKEGMVTRDYTNKDRRVTGIKLTTEGLEYIKRRFDTGNERAKRVMDCLDVTEQKLLVNLTERMRKKMTQLIESP